MTDPFPSDEAGRTIAQSLAVDQAAGDVLARLRDAGVRGILLKGASFRDWLYADGPPREYRDCDVLVSPRDVPAAEAVLQDMGLRHPPTDDLPGDKPWHAHAWVADGRPSVDLHRTLIGAHVAHEDLWTILSGRTQRMTVGGVEVEVLDPAARALHVALHATQGGPTVKRPLLDLARAIERVPLAVWRDAAGLAERVGALQSFAAGLRLDPNGMRLAEELALPPVDSVEVILRSAGAPAEAIGLEWLTRVPGLRRKLGLILRKAFPPKDFMLAWSPMANLGRAGLATAYVLRPFWLLAQMPRAIAALREARRKASSGTA